MEALLEHKAAGNEAYKAKDMAAAIEAYSQAIKCLPALKDADDSDSDDAAVDLENVDPDLVYTIYAAPCHLRHNEHPLNTHTHTLQRN